MNRKTYCKEKEQNEEIIIQKRNSEKLCQKERIFDEEEIKKNPYNESESSREDYLPVNEDLFKERSTAIKGISLAFVFFSVLIYSLLYMLAPEKAANLIFEGNFNSSLFNNTLCKIGKIGKIFYKLDAMNIRENMIIFNISLNCILNNNNKDNNNNLMIKMIYLKDTKIINSVLIMNNFISKEINDILQIYNEFKINDFPFWLCLYNKDNKNNIKNITSDYLMNFF
jgi:hypothetical protein